MTVCDLGEGLAVLHRDAAVATTGVRGPTAAAAGHRELAACFHQVGVQDAVDLHQPAHADAMAIGDLGEGFAVLDGDLAGQGRQGQHQGQGQGDEGATHGRDG